MKTINLEGINPVVSNRIRPFVEVVLKGYEQDIHSIYIVGSAVTADFNEKTSDINSVIVLSKISFDFMEFLAPLGKKYGKKRIAAPLIMTLDYIKNSLDVFPIEFHDFRLIHKTIYGEDILKELQINHEHLRLQCERDIKIKLIGIRQGYIGCSGDKELISTLLIKSFTGCIPLFRAIIYLLGKEPPVMRHDVIKTIQGVFADSDVFEELLLLRNGQIKPSKPALVEIFKKYYTTIEKISGMINELTS
ncbi:hypothetical protein JZK55_16550 [Dissulfurispira thermophila]|uniref:Polymerase nucleotidyl transferase domain-containing protein n=2 Tax=root TaxID=1 RepID=A0A7G1H3P6_9BACT|nr:hypothetical protein [Dissulfurispira thermophila]BCB96733.1 hypothetical protein JZK55_16550 [Dissulfurispira thermophila]